MLINHKYKFMFFHIPKSAGTSIREALSETFEGCKKGKIGYHGSCKKAIEVYGEEDFSNYFKFAIIRNPLDRLLSIYSFTIERALQREEARKQGLKTKKSIDQEADLQAIKEMSNMGPKKWILETAYNDHLYGKDLKRKSQFEWICDDQGQILVDQVFSLNDLGAMETALKEKFGKEVRVPKSNSSKLNEEYKSLKEDSEILEFVNSYFKPEINHFDFQI